MEKIAVTLREATVHYAGASSEHISALERVSLDLYRGSWTALVGRNGGGKSTLSKALAGIAPLSGGCRSVDEDVSVHMVLQQPETQILGETVFEELALCASRELETSSPDAVRSRWKELLRGLGLTVPLDAPVKRLSGGQKQLLNVAGCLVAGADCIVFDEATSMLDPASRQAVLNAAVSLHRSGRTIVWATHRMEEVAAAERVLVMEHGRIVYDGGTEIFFYGDGESPPCESLGFEPPFVVRTAKALLALGYPLATRPLRPEALIEAVTTA
ncbi:ATP-binding cassette domain-containing protein [Paenibacillus sp.]|uniref:ATP-binding cassette domain-containing protein n=1 Tax=Paenibacillus sp. TaxID=58172 RepID=UPI002811DB52|nr:ATP-binding cassette domain-containing protein [Paenibacillus sp.]